MRIALLLPLLVACGGSDDPPHWNKQPLETMEGTNEGVTFTVQLPKGMQKSKVESKYSVEWSYHAKLRGEDYVFAPSISVSKASKGKTMAEDIAREKEIAKKDVEVLWKEETPNGWAYASPNDISKGKEDFIVVGETTTGDVTLRCHARLFPMRKGNSTKGDIPAVGKMCLSMKPK